MKRHPPLPDRSEAITAARVERAVEFMTYVVKKYGQQYAPILDSLRHDLDAMREGESHPRGGRSKRASILPDRSEITDDTPLRLDTAARLAFPDGVVSGNALRNAASRGDLEHERLAGRVITTLRWVREWRERNRHSARPRVQPDISEERRSAALASAMQAVKELRRPKKTGG